METHKRQILTKVKGNVHQLEMKYKLAQHLRKQQ